jgi:hypothetical protein
MKTLAIILMTGHLPGYLFLLLLLSTGLFMILAKPIYLNSKRKFEKRLEEYEKRWDASVLFIFSNDNIVLKSKSSSHEGWIPVIHVNEAGNRLPSSAIDFSEIMMDKNSSLKRIKKDSDLGYFNIQTGKIIKPQYKVALPFHKGLAQVQTFEQDVLIINENGICI